MTHAELVQGVPLGGTESGDNAERIIAATIEVIAVCGVERVTLKDVSAEAGVSIGTIQHYFKRRDKLIDEALYRYTHESVNFLRKWSDASADPWTAIVDMFTAYGQRDNWGRTARVWITLVNASMHEVSHLRMLNTITEEWRKLFRDVIHRGIVAGRFSPEGDVDDIVEIMIGLTDAFTVRQVGSVIEYGPRMQSVVRVFLDMLKLYLNVHDLG
jgi:AcrR family transcriptional regulator